MTPEKIKTLPRTDEGIFDLREICGYSDIYSAAADLYSIYTAYETKENKKEGYPDILQQLRVWNRKANEDFTFENAAGILALLLAVIRQISPEIYENYRELVDMFRAGVKRVIAEYYDEASGSFPAGKAETLSGLQAAIRTACEMDLLIAEKYAPFFEAAGTKPDRKTKGEM